MARRSRGGPGPGRLPGRHHGPGAQPRGARPLLPGRQRLRRGSRVHHGPPPIPRDRRHHRPRRDRHGGAGVGLHPLPATPCRWPPGMFRAGDGGRGGRIRVPNARRHHPAPPARPPRLPLVARRRPLRRVPLPQPGQLPQPPHRRLWLTSRRPKPPSPRCPPSSRASGPRSP